MNKYRITLMALCMAICTQAKVTLPSFFTDNMVIQQKSTLILPGKAKAGKQVTVKTSWDNRKSTLLALVGAIVADRSQRVSLLHVAAVVVAYQVLGGIAEWLIASDLSAALQDFKIGFPGMLLQVVLGWVILKGLAKYEC